MFLKGVVFCAVTILAVHGLEDVVDPRSRQAKVDNEYLLAKKDQIGGKHRDAIEGGHNDLDILQKINQLNSKMNGKLVNDNAENVEDVDVAARDLNDTQNSWDTLPPNSFFPFGKLSLAKQNNCSWKEFISYDVVDDQMIQCQKINDKKCYSSQETFFETYTTEVCDETYSKNCHISFTEETSNVPVEVCYTETRRVCDNRKRNLDGFEEYSAVNETCLSVFETVCETYKTTRVVSDDYADCEVQSLELCERSGKCPKIPKTKCEIVTKNVTKEIPESKCRKITKSICGPEDCPVRVMPELCRNETKQTTSKIPVETCTLTPKKECRDVSILVPTLVPTEKCMEVPKEICTTIVVPRNITRTSSRLACENQSSLDGDFRVKTLPSLGF